jgi:beta propeller repeat protein
VIARRTAWCLAGILLVLLVPGIASASTVPVCTDTAHQQHPAISGSIVVWQDHRNGNWDIYARDMATGVERQVTSSSFDETNPQISGSRVVWESYESGMYKIRTRSLVAGQGGVTTVATSTLGVHSPDIDGTRIVYSKSRQISEDIWASDVFCVDLPLKFYEELPSDMPTQVTTSGRAKTPRVSGNHIVWDDIRAVSFEVEIRQGDDWDVYLTTYGSGTETLVSRSTEPDYGCDIDGDFVVYEMDPCGDGLSSVIFIYSIADGSTQYLTPGGEGAGAQKEPAIAGTQVAFVGRQVDTGTRNVHLATIGQTAIRTIDTGGQPKRWVRTGISDVGVVWQDERNGNDDIYASIDTPGPQPPLTVTSPNGGENWVVGTTQSITWTYSGIWGADAAVKIELFKGPLVTAPVRTITSSCPLMGGSSSWEIDTELPAGTDYWVKVTSLGSTPVSDSTDGWLSITAAPTLTVTFPGDGDTWVRGYPATIAWTQAGLEGTNVKIELFKGPLVANPRLIAASVPAETGVFQWTVPSDLAGGTDYWVRVQSLSFPSVFDNSEGWVTVLVSPLTFTPTVTPTMTAAPTLGPVNIIPGGSGIPRDLDGDGKYEDVNGNGRKDFADVTLYFNQLTWIGENEPLAAFDYNGNGRIDFADVTWLFNHL